MRCIGITYACCIPAREGMANTASPLHFVGRTEELGVLRAALDSTEAGRAPVVIMHGEAGVGKTRTGAEFAEHARGRAATVLWGSCFEHANPLTYCPWGDAVDSYLAGGEVEAGTIPEDDEPALGA